MTGAALKKSRSGVKSHGVDHRKCKVIRKNGLWMRRFWVCCRLHGSDRLARVHSGHIRRARVPESAAPPLHSNRSAVMGSTRVAR